MVLWLLVACDNEIFPTPEGGGGGTVSGDTYADVKKIFDGSCVSCHNDGGSPLGNLNLKTDACAAIVGVNGTSGEPLVDPGSHETSYLWKRVDAGQMPPGSGLAQTNVDTIAAWIDAGASCTDTTGGTTTGNTATAYTYQMVQEKVFDTQCTYCHAVGADPDAEFLVLTAPDSYANLVNVAAAEVADVKRIDPGSPDTSFLMHKLRGINIPDGTAQMPEDAAPMDPELVTLVYGWILAGAPQ